MINNKAMNGQHKSPLKSVPCVMCWTILVVYLYNIQLQFCQCAPDPVKVFFLSNIAFSCLCHRLLAPKIALAEGEIHCKWAAWMCFLAVTLQFNSYRSISLPCYLNILQLANNFFLCFPLHPSIHYLSDHFFVSYLSSMFLCGLFIPRVLLGSLHSPLLHPFSCPIPSSWTNEACVWSS